MEFGLLLLILLAALLPLIIMVGILLGDGSVLHKLLWILMIWFLPCIGIIAWLVLAEQTKDLGRN